MTPVKPEKNACPASALFQCSLIRSDAADADAAAAGHKTTQRRRRPPVRRRTALVKICRDGAEVTSLPVRLRHIPALYNRPHFVSNLFDLVTINFCRIPLRSFGNAIEFVNRPTQFRHYGKSVATYIQKGGFGTIVILSLEGGGRAITPVSYVHVAGGRADSDLVGCKPLFGM